MTANTQRESAVRVLFVDDSRVIRFAANRFLKDEFDVVTANDGHQAWLMLDADPAIRVVVTDLLMPEVDGVELIRRIRTSQVERIRSLPVLVVTSVEERAGRRRALDAGANDLVPKPFSVLDLVDPIRGYLQWTRQQHAAASAHARMPNIERTRMGFLNRLDQMAAFHDRHGLDFSLLHARLDNYQEITERFGLNYAEAMVRHLERVLAREVRIEDTVGRSDDAVFSMLLMNTRLQGARQLRERLREQLRRQPVHFPGRTLPLDVSFSVQCPSRTEMAHADALLQAGLAQLERPANVTRLSDRISA